MEKYGVDNPSKLEEIQEKKKETCMERYGVEYSVLSNQAIVKKLETLEERYGGHYMKLDEYKYKGTDKSNQTKIDRGISIPLENYTEYELYRKVVRKLTDRNRTILLEQWDGCDYYDGEYIKDYFELNYMDDRYPNLDHKTSIIYGLLNGVFVDEISKMDNLCFTKRSINSYKRGLTEEEYDQKK